MKYRIFEHYSIIKDTTWKQTFQSISIAKQNLINGCSAIPYEHEIWRNVDFIKLIKKRIRKMKVILPITMKFIFFNYIIQIIREALRKDEFKDGMALIDSLYYRR